MRKISLLLGFLLFCLLCYSQDVFVNGYYRKDGTYVRPHWRSKPDGIKSNNYGPASYRQRQQYQGLSVIPSYNNDYDDDGIANRYDLDDDNDGIMDDYDSSQYGRSKNSQSYSYPYYDSYNYDYGSYNYDSDDYSGW